MLKKLFKKTKNFIIINKNSVNKYTNTGSYWTQMQTQKRPMLSWLELPEIRSYVNKRVSGNTQKGWFSHLNSYKTQFDKALIVGCGNGKLERGLSKQGYFNTALGIDIAEGSLKLANENAKKNNIHNLSYKYFNIEKSDLKKLGNFDLIIVNMVAHHIDDLNTFFLRLNSILTKDGILAMNEYVGPNRFKLNKKTIKIINQLLDSFPKELKKDFLPRDEYREHYKNATEDDFQKSDPSEAINSENIEKFALKNLKLDKKFNYGGNITHMLFNGIAENFNKKKYLINDYLRLVMTFEEILEEQEVVKSDFAVYYFKKKFQNN